MTEFQPSEARKMALIQSQPRFSQHYAYNMKNILPCIFVPTALDDLSLTL